MDGNGIWQVTWDVLNSPAVIAGVAALVLWLLNRVYAKKPAWQAFEGTIIAGIKWAEKQIPDDSENKSLSRLNAAMQYVVKVEEVNGKRPPAAIEADLRGVQILHAELEATESCRSTWRPRREMDHRHSRSNHPPLIPAIIKASGKDR